MRWGPERCAAVWFALAASACGDPARDDENCGRLEGQTIVVELPADPPLELRLESCRVDIDACPRLCAFVMERDGLEPSHDTCEVEFGTDQVVISYGYGVWSNFGCPLEASRDLPRRGQSG